MWWRRKVLLIPLILLTLSSAFFISRYGQAAVKGLLLVLEVLPDPPVRPLASLTSNPYVEGLEYKVEDKTYKATIYRPKDSGKHGAIILSLGVNPDYDDPTFLRLANGLARSGIVAMVPEPVYLEQGLLDETDIEALIAAFKTLYTQPYVDQNKVGYAGFCVGASFVSIAAQDSRIAADVRFLSLLGPYYDIFSVMQYVNSRSFSFDGIEQPWQPEGMVEEIYARHVIASLGNASERELLEKKFVWKEAQEFSKELLSEDAKEVYEVLSRTDISKLDKVIQDFPAGYKSKMEKLSPKKSMGNLKAKVFVLHDRNDTYIPFVESRRFFEALPESVRSGSIHTESEIFQHMHPTRAANRLTLAKEVAKLYRHLYLSFLEAL